MSSELELDHKAHGSGSTKGRRSQTDHTWRRTDECGLVRSGLMSQVFVWTKFHRWMMSAAGSTILPAILARSSPALHSELASLLGMSRQSHLHCISLGSTPRWLQNEQQTAV